MSTVLTLEAFRAKKEEVLMNIHNILRHAPNRTLALTLLGGELYGIYKCSFKAIGVAKGCKGKLKIFLERYSKERRWSHIRLHQVAGVLSVSLDRPAEPEETYKLVKQRNEENQDKVKVDNNIKSEQINLKRTAKVENYISKIKKEVIIDVDDEDDEDEDKRESEDMDLETSNDDLNSKNSCPKHKLSPRRTRKRDRNLFAKPPAVAETEIVNIPLTSSGESSSSNNNSNSKPTNKKTKTRWDVPPSPDRVIGDFRVTRYEQSPLKSKILESVRRVTSLLGTRTVTKSEPAIIDDPLRGVGIPSVDGSDPGSGGDIAKQESEVEDLRRRLQEKEDELRKMKKKVRQDELMKLLKEKQLRLKLEVLKKKVQSVKSSSMKKKPSGFTMDKNGPIASAEKNGSGLKPLRIFSQTFRLELDFSEISKQNSEKKFSKNMVENEIAVLKQRIASEEKRRKENTMSSTLVQMKAVKLAEIDVRKLEIKIQNHVKKLNDTSAKLLKHIYEDHNNNKVITKRKSAADFFL